MTNIYKETALETLEKMLSDFNTITKDNLDLVVSNLPVGVYNMLFTQSTIEDAANMDNKRKEFFLLYHDCLDHEVTDGSAGHQFLQTLRDQLV